MPFNPDTKRKIVRGKDGNHLPCKMCGITYPPPDAVHIIDEKEWKQKKKSDLQCNGIPLCPNCHRVFEEYLRPKLFNALKEFGVEGLPKCWRKNNKISDLDEEFAIEIDN
jgi:predicted restriction endonuclease